MKLHPFRPTLLLRRPLSSPLRTQATHISPPPPSQPPLHLVRRLAAPITSFFIFYGASQRAHPWLTQIATTTTINTLGDLNAQLLFPASPDAEYDYTRTGRMTLTGALLAIPVNAWYTRISYRFLTLPKKLAIFLRVALSQAIFTPIFLVSFFGVQGALEAKSLDEIKEKIWTTGPRAWRDGLVLWPAVSTVNFALVPLEYRALLGGVASLGWNTWLSYLNSRTKAQMEVQEVVAGAPVVAEV